MMVMVSNRTSKMVSEGYFPTRFLRWPNTEKESWLEGPELGAVLLDAGEGFERGTELMDEPEDD